MFKVEYGTLCQRLLDNHTGPFVIMVSRDLFDSQHTKYIQKLVSNHELLSKKLDIALIELKQLKVKVVGIKTSNSIMDPRFLSLGLSNFAEVATEDAAHDAIYKVVEAIQQETQTKTP